MAQALKVLEQEVALVKQFEATPSIVLLNPEIRNPFIAEVWRTVEAHVPDVTTTKGRKAIASLAYDVAQTKTAITRAAKALTEEARQQINMVNAERNAIEDELQAIQDLARKPLTEWEAQQARYREAFDAEKRRADEAEAARIAEQQRIADEAAAKKAADDKRAADQRHRAKIMLAAAAALMRKHELGQELAEAIVLNIAAGNIPHGTINF